MKIQYLDLEEILDLHFKVIEGYGGSHGVRDEGRLMSVVEALKQQTFGVELYPAIYEKAAVYFRNIVGDHPFSDGNKRTATTVCAVFLWRNGLHLKVETNVLAAFAIEVAVDHLSI